MLLDVAFLSLMHCHIDLCLFYVIEKTCCIQAHNNEVVKTRHGPWNLFGEADSPFTLYLVSSVEEQKIQTMTNMTPPLQPQIQSCSLFSNIASTANKSCL